MILREGICYFVRPAKIKLPRNIKKKADIQGLNAIPHNLLSSIRRDVRPALFETVELRAGLLGGTGMKPETVAMLANT